MYNFSQFTGWKERKYNNAEELSKKIDEYFEQGEEDEIVTSGGVYKIKRFTSSGLIISLDFASRQSLYDYKKKYDWAKHLIERAQFWIENHYEKMLQSGNVAGAKFALQQCGWKEKQEVDQNLNNTINVVSFQKNKEPDDKKAGNIQD